MKKILFIVMIVALFASCNFQTKVANSGIPTEFQKLEFWNGGGLIGSYENVTMKMEIVTSTKLVGQDIYFYKYHVINKKQGIDEYIIDSEALALKYTVMDEE